MLLNTFNGRDCATRRGPKQQMLERILEQVEAIKRVFARDKSSCLFPQLTWQDFSVSEAVNSRMKLVGEFTDVLSGENFVTVSSLLPMLAHMEGVLKDSEQGAKLTADLKRVVLEQMEGKYAHDAIQKMMRKATLLDPRYRDHMKPAELSATKTELVAEMAAAATRAVPTHSERR